jgi:hypothetical protein
VNLFDLLCIHNISKGLDPHQDTPVKILHVVLLGFVKYIWRDAISCMNDAQKGILTIRLSSVDVTGLGIPLLTGQTLVKYAGSLTGCDFWAIAQTAPFVLYDLVPRECYNTWLSLCLLLPFIWQPMITNLDEHLMSQVIYKPLAMLANFGPLKQTLQSAIDHFLNCAARWTPHWFNKPKFHIIQHLVDHICRFCPTILFATEGFESFNAVIRAQSIHSNHHAPSRDIGCGFAPINHVHHLLSGG